MTLYGTIVTYGRPAGFSAVLDALQNQTRMVDHLIVVDNNASGDHEPDQSITDAVARYTGSVQIVTPGENTGPAGGTAWAMETAQSLGATADDWLIRFDDDTPLPFDDLVERIETFGRAQRQADPMVGAVGAVGSRYDWDRGRLVRVDDSELGKPVDVDYVATNCFAAFSFAAIEAVGPFNADLFYGSSEVEYGLRLRRGGWRVVADGELWQRFGRASSATAGPRRRLQEWNWRRYYSTRNQIHILRQSGHRGAAVRLIAVRAIGKPLVNLAVEPGLALQHLRGNSRAVRDGWTGRLGRRLEPTVPGGQ